MRSGDRGCTSRRAIRTWRVSGTTSRPSAGVTETGIRGVAASSIAWERAQDDAVAAMLREEGCRGVELAPTKWRDRPTEASIEDIAAHRAWWAERGLAVIAFQALL